MAGAIPRRRSGSAFALLAILAGCRSQPRSGLDRNPASSTERVDSLVATGQNGVTVWFTLERTGRAADGTTCVERALEIRHGDTRVPVPLLYTGSTPILLDEATMRAELWNHCRPVASYLVSLRTGQPRRERGGAT